MCVHACGFLVRTAIVAKPATAAIGGPHAAFAAALAAPAAAAAATAADAAASAAAAVALRAAAAKPENRLKPNIDDYKQFEPMFTHTFEAPFFWRGDPSVVYRLSKSADMAVQRDAEKEKPSAPPAPKPEKKKERKPDQLVRNECLQFGNCVNWQVMSASVSNLCASFFRCVSVFVCVCVCVCM
jgi:hypothetical protein